MEKQELRQRILKMRTTMDLCDLKTLSELINDKLLLNDRVKDASCIMAYYSYKNEPDLKNFIQACLHMGKTIALPYIAGQGEMIAVRYEDDGVMKSNVYGIPEPVLTSDSEEEEPDVIIVPGIAFDKALNRIGFGGGYYDRYLQGRDAYKIGVCFDYQITDNIDTDAHDVRMDIIVTEKRVLGGEECA